MSLLAVLWTWSSAQPIENQRGFTNSASLSHLAGPTIVHRGWLEKGLLIWRKSNGRCFCNQTNSPNAILLGAAIHITGHFDHPHWNAWQEFKRTSCTTSSPAHAPKERHLKHSIWKPCHAPSPSSRAAPPAQVVCWFLVFCKKQHVVVACWYWWCSREFKEGRLSMSSMHGCTCPTDDLIHPSIHTFHKH